MASLQAAHTQDCDLRRVGRPDGRPPLKGRMSPVVLRGETLDVPGCSCSPTYYAVVRVGPSKTDYHPAGKNKKDARRLFTSFQGEVDKGSYRPPEKIVFETWADEWHKSLKRPREGTKNGYLPSLGYAKEAFGKKLVNDLTVSDITRMIGLMEQTGRKVGPSTQNKHLRVVSACLKAAVKSGKALSNPVVLLGREQRPSSKKRKGGFFEDDELPVLFAKIPEGLYRTLFLLALKTGARQGELVALKWSKVDLVNGELSIDSAVRAKVLDRPKTDKSIRTFKLNPEIVDLLARWKNASGADDDDLVFPDRRTGGYIDGSHLTRYVLYPAMKAAGVPRQHPRQSPAEFKPRDFHSLRHTFVRIAIEQGRNFSWLEDHIGHEKLVENYRHFSDKAARAEADALVGVFPV